MADYSQTIETFPSEAFTQEENGSAEFEELPPEVHLVDEQTGVVPIGARLGSGDLIPPVITVISPSPGSELPRNAAVVFTVTDELALRDVIVWAEIVGFWEVIWGGDATGFSPAYEASTRSSIQYGFEFTVRRAGAWTSSPVFHALAFDTGGNQA